MALSRSSMRYPPVNEIHNDSKRTERQVTCIVLKITATSCACEVDGGISQTPFSFDLRMIQSHSRRFRGWQVGS